MVKRLVSQILFWVSPLIAAISTYLLWAYFGDADSARRWGMDSNEFPMWFYNLQALGAGYGIPLLLQIVTR